MDKLTSQRLLKVGFTGPSGAGKSTISEYFGQNTGFTVFHGDGIRFKGVIAHPKLAKEIFGRAPEPGEDARTFAYNNYLPINKEKELALFQKLLMDYVEQQLVWAFNNPTTDFGSHDIFHDSVSFQPEGKPKGFAVDMFAFHLAKHLLRRTDFLVFVDSKKGKRKEMLRTRDDMQGFIELGKFDEVVAVREAVQKELMKGFKALRLKDLRAAKDTKTPLLITNNYNNKSLKQGQKDIIATIHDRGIFL